MAKQNPFGGERSKVRLLFVEGEFAAGEIQALATAFARPTLPVRPSQQKRIAAATTDNGVLDAETEVSVEEEATIEEDDAASVLTPTPKVPRGKRTYPTPEPVEIDLESGDKPFRAFASEKVPATHLDKYLVVAEWLRAYRAIPTITTGHVRTCYIAADWTFDVQDPNQPFRTLKKNGFGSIADSKFTINHLGVAEVKRMNSATASNT
jgi:hypothetical protein